MEVDSSRIRELIERPSESLSVELKRWIDPDHPDGIAKIVKTVLALRNHGGGYMVIGFDNKTLEPHSDNIPEKVEEQFHIDKIQGLISKYASEPFEVSIEFPRREDQSYPVIVVPPGIKTPIASKSELPGEDKSLVKLHAIYVRSLNANNTPSTTQAMWKDWPKIVEVCFDNREADIGRFLRRHLGGLSSDVVGEFARVMTKREEPEVTTEDRLREYMQESDSRFSSVIQTRNIELPEHGSWEVGLIIIGDVPEHSANRKFLNLLDSNNPNYTGWPVWLDSRGFRDKESNPYVLNGEWEALVQKRDVFGVDHDFMRLDPKGKFYLRRALQEDDLTNPRIPDPLTVLDVGLPVLRTAEAIAVGISFAKAMGCSLEETGLAFAFRWSKLNGRKLVSWAERGSRTPLGEYIAYQDSVLVQIQVPLETPLSALGEFVCRVVQPLHEIFDGYTMEKETIEDRTRRLLERRL